MEYSRHYDYLIKFDAQVDREGEIIQYLASYVSENFDKISHVKAYEIIGKSMTQIIELFSKGEEDCFFLEDIYSRIGPNVARKFEKYMPSTDRWYLVNVFTREKNLLILYTDITVIKKYLINIDDNNFGNSKDQFYKDGLTGLYIKDYFKVELSRLDCPKNYPLSIVIGDLNGLKLINDAFGYHMGDEAIKTIADILRESFRKKDILSRLGGDEFVILLPQTSYRDAVDRINETKVKFKRHKLDFLELNMSFGCATKVNSKQNIMHTFKKAEEAMYFEKLKESNSSKMKLVEVIKEQLRTNKKENISHIQRLKKLGLIFGEEVGLSLEEQRELKFLCEYHDIGTIGIPDYIYNKKEKLRDEEWRIIKRHCEIGYHIIKSISFDKSTAENVLMHHERWDGKGYPRQIKGKEIPLVVRMFTIIDSFEAMINHRPYRKKLSIEQTLEELKSNSGRQFDPKLVEIFISLINNSIELKDLAYEGNNSLTKLRKNNDKF